MKFELVEKSLTNRGKIVDASEISEVPCDYERYASLFGFDESIIDWVKYQKTVQGFSGSYGIKVLYFDIDVDIPGADQSDSLALAQEHAKNFLLGIQNSLNISPKYFDIFFSGGKGFHIGLHEKMVGQFTPSQGLPVQIQNLVHRIVAKAFNISLEDIKKGKSYNGIDLSIYNKNRIFRLPLSKNMKSGFYKIRITSDELFNLDISEIIQLAEEPRDIPREVEISRVYKVTELEKLWAAAQKYDTPKEAKGFSENKEYVRVFEAPTKGDRNNQFFKMCCHLFDNTELSTFDISDIIHLMNNGTVNPLPSNEISMIIKSAEKKTAPNRMRTLSVENKNLYDFSDLVEDWYSYHTSEKKRLTSGFEDIDRDMKQQFIGTVGVIAGSSGTLKSYFTNNFLWRNIVENHCKVLLSSMEMGKIQLTERIMDMIMDMDEDYARSLDMTTQVNTTSEIAVKGLKNHPLQIKESIKEASKSIASNLIVTNKSFKTVKDYEKDIEEAIRLFGGVDMLIIDGLANMGGSNDETTRMSENTTQLKELAKQYDIAILCIAHTTRASNEYARDSRPFIRGGEKVADNMDYSISMSKLIDETKSSQDEIVPVRNKGHIKFFNKRGSGNTINLVYRFDPIKKLMEKDNSEPYMYPTIKQFEKNSNKWASNESKGWS